MAASQPQGASLQGQAPVAMSQPAGLMNSSAISAAIAAAFAQSTAKAAKAAEAAPAVKRQKKRKLPDGELSEKALTSIAESADYNHLVELNRTIDDLLQRRRSEIREAVASPAHTRKRLRLYILNQHAHQAEAAAAATTAAAAAGVGPSPNPDPPAWALQIVGRVLDGPDGPLPGTTVAAQGAAPLSAAVRQPMTAYLRRVEVRLDPALYPGQQGLFVWDRAQHVGPHRDALEVRRIGNQNVNTQLTIEVDWQPERVVLPAPLAELLGLQYETRNRVLLALYQYIKLHHLQDPAQPHVVTLNASLVGLFGAGSLRMSSIAERLMPLLQKMPPLVFNHMVRVDGRSPSHPQCFDIDIDLPSSTPTDRISPGFDHFNKDRQIEALDAKIMGNIRCINEHRRRRSFFLAFSQSPVDFINALVASQHDDLRLAKSYDGRSYELERRGEVFKGKWVDDAIVKYLARKLAAGHH